MQALQYLENSGAKASREQIKELVGAVEVRVAVFRKERPHLYTCMQMLLMLRHVCQAPQSRQS